MSGCIPTTPAKRISRMSRWRPRPRRSRRRPSQSRFLTRRPRRGSCSSGYRAAGSGTGTPRPSVQFNTTIEGELEITMSDGESRIFGAGRGAADGRHDGARATKRGVVGRCRRGQPDHPDRVTPEVAGDRAQRTMAGEASPCMKFVSTGASRFRRSRMSGTTATTPTSSRCWRSDEGEEVVIETRDCGRRPDHAGDHRRGFRRVRGRRRSSADRVRSRSRARNRAMRSRSNSSTSCRRRPRSARSCPGSVSCATS